MLTLARQTRVYASVKFSFVSLLFTSRPHFMRNIYFNDCTMSVILIEKEEKKYIKKHEKSCFVSAEEQNYSADFSASISLLDSSVLLFSFGFSLSSALSPSVSCSDAFSS